MTNANTISEPKLAAPGAGLPFYKKLVLRLFIRPFVASKTPWEISKKRYSKISNLILAEVNELSIEKLSVKKLVPKQSGLEDSSRYWSIAMTLEHLMIVGKEIDQIILSLGNSIVPNKVADTAKVKPAGKLSAQQVLIDFNKHVSSEFETLNEKLIFLNKDSGVKFKHPWFGKMTAKEWYWLLPVHMNLHLIQIQEIKKQL